jgi:hypothetical protein
MEGACGPSHRGVAQAPAAEPEVSGTGSSHRAGGARAPGTEERKARRRPPMIPAEQSLTFFFILSGNSSFHRADCFFRKTISFVRLTGYYRRFIKDFSKIAKPMTRLLKKNKDFDWTEECQVSFEE